jgi:hypothetical protein
MLPACRIFERGLAYVATDYGSHTLWDKYIQFETAQGSLAAVGDIYTRILRCPLKELERYQNRCAWRCLSCLLCMRSCVAHLCCCTCTRAQLPSRCAAVSHHAVCWGCAALQAMHAELTLCKRKWPTVHPTRDPHLVFQLMHKPPAALPRVAA